MSCNGSVNELAAYTRPLTQSESIGEANGRHLRLRCEAQPIKCDNKRQDPDSDKGKLQLSCFTTPWAFWLSEIFRLEIVNTCSKQGMGRSDLNRTFYLERT